MDPTVIISSTVLVFVLLVVNYSFAQYDSVETLALSDEKRLIKHLLDHYQSVGIVGRPVYNTSETVHVSYGLALIQILDLDEKNQVLTTNVWSRYLWKDIVLQWDPQAYGGVTRVRVPADKIWMPDILLYNHADERLKDKREIMALVDYDGTVMWVPLSIFKSTCPINIRNFPYDIQNCSLKFGSWTYDGTKVDLGFFDDLESVDVTDYMPSNEWKLLAHPAVKHVKYYPCCPEPYIDLTFRVVIKRIGIYYTYTLILPCVLLSVLTLVIFWIPPESSAKMIMGLNIFLAFFLQLKVLARATPPGSEDIPVIGSFFCMNMVLITFSTFLSVIVVNLYFRGDKKTRLPKPVRKFFLSFLARLLFMHSEYRKEKQRNKYLVKKHQEHTITIDGRTKRRSRERRKIKSPVLTYNKWEAPTDTIQHSPIASRHPTPERTPLHCMATEMEVREMKKTLKNFLLKIHQRDAWAKVAKEWRMVALVIDRFFFFIYITVIVISLITIFPHNTIPVHQDFNQTNFL